MLQLDISSICFVLLFWCWCLLYCCFMVLVLPFLLVSSAPSFAQNQTPNTLPKNIRCMHNRLSDSIVKWDSYKTKLPNGHTDVQARVHQKRRAKFHSSFSPNDNMSSSFCMHAAFNLSKTSVPVCSIACLNIHYCFVSFSTTSC